MKQFPFIYLASKSQRRREFFKAAGIPFKVVSSNFKEKFFPGGVRQTVIKNAIGKAKCAQVHAKSGVVLGADTLVYSKGKLLGKPKNKSAAFRMLKSLAGTRHYVYTGIALFNLETKKWKKACVKSTIVMKKMSDDQVRHYLSKVNPLDKAGAYAIQEHGDKLIKRIEGSYTNVVGLPMEKLKELLKTFCHCETR